VARKIGVAASGSAEVTQTAVDILEAGGNAFDAALGALCTASIAEPLLASLGGGGFLVALPNEERPRVYDFFCQTPGVCRPSGDIDFFPILADFGAAHQEFHVGLGAGAVPGVVAGIFDAHADLGRMPIAEIMQPAASLARSGVLVDAFHDYIIRILKAIITATPEAFGLYESPGSPGELISAGELLRNPKAADALDALASEGPDLFYRGEWAERLAADCAEKGGHISLEDMSSYRVVRREPVVFRYRDVKIAINPPPSPGGCLVAFALGVLSDWNCSGRDWGGPEHMMNLLRAMRAASIARHDFSMEGGLDSEVMGRLLSEDTIQEWQQSIRLHSLFSRGTTHISVADADGNLASLTASNGEGCAYVLPGTGIMLNNMLGEEDLHPAGFNRWKPGVRLASMMSPTVVEKPDGTRFALGSGGSNRIRSAVTQVLVNLLDFGMASIDAVAAPRIHLEGGLLSVEPDLPAESVEVLDSTVPSSHHWPERNLFFGGVHTVSVAPGGVFEGAGDPRRGGAAGFACKPS